MWGLAAAVLLVDDSLHSSNAVKWRSPEASRLLSPFLYIPKSSLWRQISELTKGKKPRAGLLEFKSQLSHLLAGDLGKVT